MDQSVLNRETGGIDAMRARAAHLAAMSNHPDVTVHTIRNRGDPGLLGRLLSLTWGPVRYREPGGHSGRAVTEDAATVSMVAVRSIASEATPSKGESPDLIEGVRQERWKEKRPDPAKSSYSCTYGGQCVEVAAYGHVLVRDTEDRGARCWHSARRRGEVHEAD